MVVISADEGSDGPEEEYTVVPGMVQHVHLTGYPSNKGAKKSVDIN